MRPAPFDLARPDTIAAAVELIAAGGVPLAGGQSLIQSMRLRQRTPTTLVDLGGIEELPRGVELVGSSLHVGVDVTHREFAENALVNEHFPWLAEAALAVGDVQIRNLGTVLGNVCWADSRANHAVGLLASEATISVTGGDPSTPPTSLPLGDFFTGFQCNGLDGRLAIGIEIPILPQARGHYLEFARQPQDLAVCNVCVVRSAKQWRVAVGGIDARPRRLPAVETQLMEGRAWQQALDDALNDTQLRPPSDTAGTREYKLGLAGTLILRALHVLEGA